MKAAKIPSLNDDRRLSLTSTLFCVISIRKKDEVFSEKLPAGMCARLFTTSDKWIYNAIEGGISFQLGVKWNQVWRGTTMARERAAQNLKPAPLCPHMMQLRMPDLSLQRFEIMLQVANDRKRMIISHPAP